MATPARAGRFEPIGRAGGAHMEHLTISVLPAPGGWTVHPVPLAEPLAFLSGADAEAAARRLAQAVRRAGFSAHVTVYDRAGQLIAQQPHAPEASPVFVAS